MSTYVTLTVLVFPNLESWLNFWRFRTWFTPTSTPQGATTISHRCAKTMAVPTGIRFSTRSPLPTRMPTSAFLRVDRSRLPTSWERFQGKSRPGKLSLLFSKRISSAFKNVLFLYLSYAFMSIYLSVQSIPPNQYELSRERHKLTAIYFQNC